MNLSIDEYRLLARHRVNQLLDAIDGLARDVPSKQKHALAYMTRNLDSATEAVETFRKEWTYTYELEDKDDTKGYKRTPAGDGQAVSDGD